MNSPIVKSEIIEAYKELNKECEEEMYIDDYIKYLDLHFDRLDFDKILDTDDDPNGREFKLTYIADFISCCCFMWFSDDITDFYKKD